jgi:biotin carboxyl carrier protein
MKPSSDLLLDLLNAASAATSAAERRFVLLNRTREWLPYEIALLWHPERGVVAHSGVSDVDRHGPYAQWVQRLAQQLVGRPAGPVNAEQVDPSIGQDWTQWWPSQLLWLPATPASGAADDPDAQAAWLLLRDLPWPADEQAALQDWQRLWRQSVRAATAQAQRPRLFNLAALKSPRSGAPRPVWQRRRGWIAAAALLGVALLPVRMTLRAPGELVPREPTVLRVALEGTIQRLRVEPNQAVQAGQVVAELDDAAQASRLQVARQALGTAEAEWRQTSQLALSDARAKVQLAAAQGKYEEKAAEVRYLEQQVQRTALLAPHAGVVLVDDPGSWSGRTVSAGEAVMRLAQPQDQELEAWLPVGDAIDLPTGSAMQLHLASRPGAPVAATLRLYAYEAERRPDGSYAYRLRGALSGSERERLGARGTVRIDGPRVPLIYWVLRRPLAALREVTGL